MIIEWLRINLFYLMSLVFIYFTYAYLLKEIIWKRNWPHIFYYFLAFSIIGGSFNYFLQPNYMKAIYEAMTRRFSFHKLSILLVSSLFWIGWVILFSETEKFIIKKFNLKEKPKPLQEYLLYFFLFLLLINSFHNYIELRL